MVTVNPWGKHQYVKHETRVTVKILTIDSNGKLIANGVGRNWGRGCSFHDFASNSMVFVYM